jgi:hypothetical protein
VEINRNKWTGRVLLEMECLDKILVLYPRQKFGEDVRDLFVAGNMLYVKASSLELVPEEVVVDINVF